MARALYTLLARLLLPFVLASLWWRGRRHPQLRVPLRERLGRSPAKPLPWSSEQRPLWIHAVSVGEVQAAAGLIAALRLRHPRLPLLLTMATPTGRARAESLYRNELSPDAAGHTPLALAYAPFDLPGAAAAFLERLRPVAAIFLETELWPNLLAACAARGLPVALVSARLSERSLRRYLRYAPDLVRRMLSGLTVIAAQSDADRLRFLALGADASRVTLTGNLKFDLTLPADLATRAQEQRGRYLGTRRAWVAGSTHAGEEEICAAAQGRLEARWREAGLPLPPPLLVMAPRHPDRFDAAAASLARGPLAMQRYSAGSEPVASATSVLLLDTLGELLAFYASAEIAFVGGSLVPIGGHNLLEPAALRRPVLTGRYSFNSPEAARLLADAGGLRVVEDAEALCAALFELFTQPELAAQMAAAAEATVAASRGAAARSLQLLEAQLPLPALP